MNFLQEKILDNTVQNLLIAAAVILGVVLFKKLLAHYAATLSYMLINKAWKMIDKKHFSVLFLKPLSRFLIVTIGIATISKLSYPRAWEFKIYKIPFDLILEKAGIIIFIYSFFKLLISVIDFITLILSQKAKLTADKGDDQLVVFFRDFLKVIMAMVGVLVILKAAFNQDISNLLTGLSIVGAALALSARESLENLIASFIIFFDKPFYVGDFLKVNNVSGTVERIGLRSTRIRTGDKTLVTVPNKQMVDSVVDNWSMRTQRRAEIKLEFSEKTTAAALQAFVASTKEILKTKESSVQSFSVFVTDYTKNGPTLTVEYFTPAFEMDDFNLLKEDISFSLMQIIEKQKMMLAQGSSINIISAAQPPADNRPII